MRFVNPQNPRSSAGECFSVGEMARKFDGATVVERAAVCAVRVKGPVITPESREVRNISGSAQRVLRVTSMFFASDSCSVGEELPLAATVLPDITTIVLAGKGKPAESHLKRLPGDGEAHGSGT